MLAPVAGDRIIRTLVVDDEPLAVERMQMLCGKFAQLQLVGTASDAASALRMIPALIPDLVLCDIAMPGMSGVELAGAIALTEPASRRPLVVFVTAYDHFAVPAFEVDAVDYLLKPVSEDRLAAAIQRVVGRLERRVAEPPPVADAPGPWLKEFWVPNRGDVVRVDAEDVEHISAERDYMRLHCRERSWLISATINELERRLDPTKFLRVHRSYIIARDRIERLHHDGNGSWSVMMREGPVIRIGRTHLPSVKRVLA